MKRDLTELKKLVLELVTSPNNNLNHEQAEVLNRLMRDVSNPVETRLLESSPMQASPMQASPVPNPVHFDNEQYEEVEDFVIPEESLSLEEREKELIIKALEKHRGKRKYAALELGISERTLYRKIKEFELG